MKKKKTIDLKSLWERSAKSQKIASTTVPIPLTIESEVQISQNVPSNPIQLLLEAPSAHDSDTSPSVQVEKEETNPSTQPDRAASPATGPRTESSPLSPISDDGDDDDDGFMMLICFHVILHIGLPSQAMMSINKMQSEGDLLH